MPHTTRHRPYLRSAFALALAALLGTAGCGQKGPLYLPDQPPTAIPRAGTADPGSQAEKAKHQPARPAAASTPESAR
jgi:predicted small lipoprotein YifL